MIKKKLRWCFILRVKFRITSFFYVILFLFVSCIVTMSNISSYEGISLYKPPDPGLVPRNSSPFWLRLSRTHSWWEAANAVNWKFDVNAGGGHRKVRNVVSVDCTQEEKSTLFTWPKWMKCGFSKPLEKNRTIWVGHKPPRTHDPSATEIIKPHKYPGNRIVTSKYTIWNFIPRNLFEQFRRIANFYFLCMAVIQLILPDSPVSPLTSVAPLVFVVVVTALKQAYEDWRRHQSDNSLNNRKVIVVKDGLEHRVKSRDIKVGDIVKVMLNGEFPCDLVMLSSNEESGECHITTASLDGETNLKIHYCVPETKSFMTAENLETLRATIVCPLPHSDLYNFNGALEMYPEEPSGAKKKCPLSPENVLLKGASLKNTAYIFGCAIYTGQQTKMALNSKMTSNKFSTVERSMNLYLIIFLLVLVVEVAICSGLLYGFNSNPLTIPPWYFPAEDLSGGFLTVIEHVLSYIVLFNYTIPISMYVTIELQKFFGSLFFVWDKELFDEKTNQFAKCNSSDLNEELGQVQYLFTDKTGTLTENDMQFRQCSIGGHRYVDSNGILRPIYDEAGGVVGDPIITYEPDVEKFILTLALCHTAHVNHHSASNGTNGYHNGSFTDSLPEYQSSSPDEKALLEACSRFGVIFRGAANDICDISYRKKTLRYERLQVLEFDSERKCMSVIIRDCLGNIYLLCKGAESSVLSRSDSGPMDVTLQHVNSYAMLGLRTLVVARRQLTDDEYVKFEEDIREARSSLDEDRNRRILQLFETMERDLEVIGATAVEDRLQDGVPETLKALGDAGIKIWILTGDKEETAVNISFSCQHFDHGMIILFLTKQRNDEACSQTLLNFQRKIEDNPLATFGLVVDGPSLAYTLKHNHHGLFLEVTSVCKAVVCCRMSPIQKAQIVRLIKKNSPRPCTAAIGDGANDVSMIQEAHVGLGIMGKEGRHAVRCSDFAFARFRFLRRVLLVHGHYYYFRVTTLVQYFFYKNLGFITPQVYYVLFAGFTPQALYDGMFLTFYNILFTSLPILVFGLFEQNVRQATLLNKPQLYKAITKNAKLAPLEFLKWNTFAIWHSLVFFFSGYFLFGDTEILSPNGWAYGNWSLGTYVFQCAVITINLKLMIESRYFTVIFLSSIAVSFIGFMLFSLAYGGSTFWMHWSSGLTMLWVYYQVISLPAVWLSTFLAIIVALTPDICMNTLSVYSKQLREYMQCGSSGENRPWFKFQFQKKSNNLTISQMNIIES